MPQYFLLPIGIFLLIFMPLMFYHFANFKYLLELEHENKPKGSFVAQKKDTSEPTESVQAKEKKGVPKIFTP